MSMKAEMEAALKVALRSGDDLRKRTLRMALAAVKLAEVDRGGELDDAAVTAVLQKEIKSRKESIEDALRAGRSDLEAANRAEMDVLLAFMPEPFSEAELEALARQAIAEAGAVGPNEFGKAMKILAPRLQGRASGDQAGRMVRKLLEQ